jgi:hypothetical protein
MSHAGELRLRILEYFLTRERAAETAKGINCVWLQRPADPEFVKEVEQVVDTMFAEGLLMKHTLPGLVAVYWRPANDTN